MSNYLYLDDADFNQIQAFTDAIGNEQAGLSIEHRKPRRFDEQIDVLTKAFSQNEFDGLILDLWLHQFANTKGEKANYRAPTLAQQLRTLGTEGKLEEFPIVLWSDDQKLKKSYSSDESAHDLFDLTCSKEDLAKTEIRSQIALQLESLVSGYRKIRQVRANNTRLYKFLGFSEPPDFLDPRINEFFEAREGRPPVHEYARFILKELLLVQGVLIDELTVAARLGVDAKASNSWDKLKNLLQSGEYQGAFKEGWSRWWAVSLESWWRSLADDMPPLQATPAPKRIELIREHTKLRELRAAKPIAKNYSGAFWTVCQATGKPLDPRDGLIIDRPNAKLWQDKLYVSLHAELDRERKLKGFRLDPLDKGRRSRLEARLAAVS